MTTTAINEDHHQIVAGLIREVRFGLNLDRLANWSKELDGFRLLDLHILKLAAENPKILLKEIREALDIPNSTMTNLIDRLENHGLLERVINQRDRRSFGLKLTPKGWQVRQEHSRVDSMVAARVLDTLSSDAEKQALVDLLTKILDGLR